MKAAGVTDDIFARGDRLLRLQDAKPATTPLPTEKVME